MGVDEAEESFTLKNMRMATRAHLDAGEPDADIGTQADLGYTRNVSVDNDATLGGGSRSRVASAEPLDAEQAEEEAMMMRQTIANADGDVEVVMEHYEEVKKSKMERRKTRSAMSDEAAELLRLQKIVNNQVMKRTPLHHAPRRNLLQLAIHDPRPTIHDLRPATHDS